MNPADRMCMQVHTQIARTDWTSVGTPHEEVGSGVATASLGGNSSER
jgi:hypothetical protein